MKQKNPFFLCFFMGDGPLRRFPRCFASITPVLLGALVCFGGALLLGGCKDPPLPAFYRPEAPPLPPDWLALLGEPHWYVEWISPDQGLRSAETSGDGLARLELDLREDCATPITACPFWPERDIPPGLMRPAGALAPFDCREGRVALTWQGGVDAVFYREMAAQWGAVAADKPGSAKRRPELFDWPRFRELWPGDVLAPEIREDPWLADWPDLARRTLESGFDRRRISPKTRETLGLPMPPGETWIAPSPFAPVRTWREGEWAELAADIAVDTLLSPRGMLRYTRNTWIWLPWD
jgi:hypothetical protein